MWVGCGSVVGRLWVDVGRVSRERVASLRVVRVGEGRVRVGEGRVRVVRVGPPKAVRVA